jgi:hypothetical protein
MSHSTVSKLVKFEIQRIVGKFRIANSLQLDPLSVCFTSPLKRYMDVNGILNSGTV